MPRAAKKAVSTAELPFPSAVLDTDGKHTVVLRSLSGLRKAQLKEWCKGYQLKESGTVSALVERLEAFSADRKAWDRLLPGARISHKGTNAGSKSKPKQSAVRCARLLDLDSINPRPAVVTHALPVQRSKDLRTVNQVMAIDDWLLKAKDVLQYTPPPETTAVLPPGPVDSLEEKAAASFETRVIDCIKLQFTEILAQVKPDAAAATPRLPSPPAPAPTAVDEMAMLVDDDDDDDDDMQGVACGGLGQVSIATSGLIQSRNSSADPTPAPRAIRTLKLTNVTIRYTDQDVKDPSTLTFAEDIPGLNRMWDDTSEFWDGISELTIHGHPIPLMYWGDAYKYSGNLKWKGLKSKVHGWKTLVMRYRKGTVEDFWAEFSVDGEHMSYTRILRCLYKQQKAHKKGLARDVREQYGERFEELFSYNKGGKVVVMTSAPAIATRYKELQEKGILC